MGFFDDDSDDEEDRKPRQIGLLDLQQSTNATTSDDKNEEEEDPLDAYMKSLNDETNNAKQGKGGDREESLDSTSSQFGGRLGVENEDEATSHWVGETQSGQKESPFSDTNTTLDNTAKGMASRALQRNFHRASDQQQRQGDVDIRLEQVLHGQMEYSKFQKSLLPTTTVGDTSNPRNTPEGHRWREDNQVTCRPPTLDPMYDFAELRDILPEQVLEWNGIKNLSKPTPVQSQTMGVALCGRDAIVTASTGSGKTLSYLWPIVAHLMANYTNASCETNSRALVLVPTRELALQVEQIARSMFAKLPLKALAITGGNMGRYQLSQKLQSTKPHCIIATPGRLLDVLSAQQKSRQKWLLPNITLLVLDEADKMIQMGFANQVTQILHSLRPDRQSLLVSATFDSRLQKRCMEWMHDPVRISVGRTGESSKHVLQHVICLPDARAKTRFLQESLPSFAAVGRTLVFCATRQGVEALAADLLAVLPVATLHGDKHLTDRKKALKVFTKGEVKVLVATDVAGRGLDIPQVSTIVNFDPAKNWDTHVHRIGRAGRLSNKEEQQQQSGSAYTLLLPSNIGFAKSMVRAYTREGRTIPPELQKLVDTNQQHQSNKRFGRWDSSSEEGGPRHGQEKEAASAESYYGPASKRSRF